MPRAWRVDARRPDWTPAASTPAVLPLFPFTSVFALLDLPSWTGAVHRADFGGWPLMHAWQVPLLLSVRVAACLAFTPLLSMAPVPATARVLVVLALSVSLGAGLGAASTVTQPAAIEGLRLLAAALCELLVGAMLGLGVLLAFAAFGAAGQLLDGQLGLGLPQVLDPQTRRAQSIFQAAFSQLGALLFLLLDGHHALLRGLALSARHLPVGQAVMPEAAAAPLLRLAGQMLPLGFTLVAPIALALLVLELLLAVLGRGLPQMNLFLVALPARFLLGLAALVLGFGGLGGPMQRVYAALGSGWEGLLEATASPDTTRMPSAREWVR